MTKIIQDMIPSKRKPPLRQSIPVEMEDSAPEPKLPPPRRRPSRGSRGIVGRKTVKPWLFGLIALICLVAIIIGFSTVYAKATVTIIPTDIVIPVNGSYTAYKDATATNTLAYEIIQKNAQGTQSVPSAIGPLVTNYAHGNVVLYNNYSDTSQKIVAGTRLSSGNGFIYTTNITVTIPGIVKGTKTNTAGSVTVGITAASGGSSYNILPSDLTTNPSYGDFSIVAYKGSPKYTGFYARLDPTGTGISGGSSGHQVIISSSTVSAANNIIKQSLQTSLFTQAQALVPAGYVMFSNGFVINYVPLAASSTSSTTANVGMQASFYGIMFKKTDLAATIAPKQYTSSFTPEEIESAQFTITNPQTFSPVTGTALNFTLIGNLDLVGTFSSDQLKAQLVGISLDQSISVFKGYSAIATAHATILPFWKRSFPSSANRINIVINR
jgi:hypothetical protein